MLARYSNGRAIENLVTNFRQQFAASAASDASRFTTQWHGAPQMASVQLVRDEALNARHATKGRMAPALQ